MRLPEWLEAALEPTVRQALDAALPDGIPQRSPAALGTIIARTAHEAYQAGRADAIAELRTTEQVAAELGLTRQRTLLLAKSRGVGWHVGNARLFRPEDVEALRIRRAGRAGWRNNTASSDSPNSH